MKLYERNFDKLLRRIRRRNLPVKSIIMDSLVITFNLHPSTIELL